MNIFKKNEILDILEFAKKKKKITDKNKIIKKRNVIKTNKFLKNYFKRILFPGKN